MIKETDPIWMGWAIHEATDGVVEESEGDNRGPVIRRYIKLAKAGREGDPYCAIAVNAALEFNGIPGTESAGARSFEWNEKKRFVKLKGPAYGAIAVFWRGSKKSGYGHVGFYVGETEHHVYTLGANQGDDFNESPFPKAGKSFGLIGYYWPVDYPKPEIKPIRLNGKGKVIKDTKAT
jgi:uncharacterized protein (TIGR02594 family)